MFDLWNQRNSAPALAPTQEGLANQPPAGEHQFPSPKRARMGGDVGVPVLSGDVATGQGVQDRTEPVARGVQGSADPSDMVQDAEGDRIPLEGEPPWAAT